MMSSNDRKYIRRSIVTIILAALLLYANHGFANPGDKVANLKKGQRAPYAGILMNRQLTDRIEAERSTQIDVEKCKIKSDEAVAICESDAKRQNDIATAKFQSFVDYHTQVVDIKDEQLDFYRQHYLPPPWYKEPAFLVGTGVVGGVVITIVSAYVVKTVR